MSKTFNRKEGERVSLTYFTRQTTEKKWTHLLFATTSDDIEPDENWST
jgi:hypothetical protein